MDYTKGTWRAWDNHIYNEDCERVIAQCGMFNFKPEEWKANTQLIASAPDLYEELVEADRVICELCKRLNPQHKDCTSCEDRESRQKAIAKAQGGK